ncbi:MAG: hypothetical protein LBL13_04225 [Bacteroidales bacterium]|jgi:hypothetical protein|nr:hypothetical protein [Bacteroidales bacterium]
MRETVYNFGEGRKHSSKRVINVSEYISRLITFKFKKGGLKILKEPIIYYSGMFSCLLVLLMFMSMGCDKPDDIIDSSEKSLWKCTLDTNATLTLTIDQLQNMMYVSTSPQNLETGRIEMFHHGDTIQYSMRGDTMHIIIPNVTYSGCGWIKTMFSADSMQLEYWGYVPAIGNLRTCYSFTRQTFPF